jgi:hypothetical protein
MGNRSTQDLFRPLLFEVLHGDEILENGEEESNELTAQYFWVVLDLQKA